SSLSREMRVIIYSIIFSFFLVFQTHSAFPQKNVEQLQNLEDQRFQAQVSQNIELLKTLLSEEVQLIHSNAYVEDKQAFLENVASGRITYQAMQAEAGRSILIKQKMAISRGILKVGGSYQGKAFDIRLRYTALYEKVKSKWLLLNWQSTKIPE
ncbi:MAG: nuclear transport factor 2 family protein, partial [Bacteroidota bacterium]